MNKVYFINSSYRTQKLCSKKLHNFECCIYDKETIENMLSNSSITKENKLYEDYVRLYILYNFGGLVIDGNCKILDNFYILLDNDMFFGFKKENEISTNIIWSKQPKNNFIKLLLEEIESNKYNNITEIFSSVFKIEFYSKYNTTIKIDNNSYIYSYDYFYPLDYEKCGKNFSENTRIIYFENRRLKFKQKLRLTLFNRTNSGGYMYINSLFSNIKFKLASKKYKIEQKFGKKDISYKKQKTALNKAINIIENYKNVEYIIIHNPRWMGVTSATKELFKNLVPLEELSRKKDINNLAKIIIKSGVNQVVFSAFAYGWEDLARNLKKINPKIRLKVFWHGSHSQVIEEINWKTNVQVIKLHKEGIIDVFATCKESLYNFYKSQGYTTSLILNTVRLSDEVKNKIKENEKYENNNIKIGIYAAGLDWRKNMYAQIAATSLIKNAEIDLVPFNFEGKVFAGKNNLKINGSEKGLPREELLLRMSQNSLNLYVTFSECAPMLPIESMEVGTICVIGNNNHYFKNTELEKYLVVNREDDVISIKEKIMFALENKKKIFELYLKWKINYDIESEKSVVRFLEK